MCVDGIACIAGSEIQEGQAGTSERFEFQYVGAHGKKQKNEMGQGEGKMSEQDGGIAKLEAYLSNVGRETATHV